MDPNAKPFWASKTIWANLLALAVSIGGVFGLDLGLSEAEQAQIVAIIITVVNVFLRFKTEKPVKMTKKGTAL